MSIENPFNSKDILSAIEEKTKVKISKSQLAKIGGTSQSNLDWWDKHTSKQDTFLTKVSEYFKIPVNKLKFRK